MSNKVKTILLGAGTTLLGMVWLILNLIEVEVRVDLLWPILVVIPGIVLIARYILQSKASWGYLLFGVLLLQLGLFFFINIFLTNYFGLENIWINTLFIYPCLLSTSLWLTWSVAYKKLPLFIAAVLATGVSLMVVCYTILLTVFNGVLGTENLENIRGIFWPFLTIATGIGIVITPFIFDLMIVSVEEDYHEDKDRTTNDIEEGDMKIPPESENSTGELEESIEKDEAEDDEPENHTGKTTKSQSSLEA